MANVPLRIYNREIESLIDQGHPSEAIAHCHHILQKYSKHLATYRLLAKAHLELKHYAEAVDIFGRVLMAMPDDFVSHVGMSIICDEQNKLDDAIWHMQRAFESQPSNPAIQGELQRLYGRRDGVEPPKVRMTRGALANMYLQGELYPQAIAEGNAVLSSDPERSDMQVLLARAYFRSGQKANASEMCADLIKKYPYSFEANRIMIELLPSTPDGAESKQLYRTRVGELDPYATFGGGSVFKADEVPDPAISFEKLEYKGGEEPEVQRWNSPLGAGSGISAAAAASSTPDWLTGGSSGTPGTQGGSAADIPDFLREAGWAESNSPEQPVSFFDEQAPVDDLTPADIPDWLKGQSPVNTAPTPITAQPGGTQSLDIPDWLQTHGASQEDNVPAWLKGTDTKSAAPEPAKADDAPDWLSNLEGAPAGDIPDWLNNLTDTKAVEPVQAGDAPEWLSGMDEKQPAEPAEGKDVLSWLSSLDEKQSTEPVQTIDTPDWQPELDTAQINISSQPADIPDWLTGLDDKKNTEPVSDPSNIPDWQPEFDASQVNTPAQPDNVADWLSGLDQKPTSEPAPIGDAPDWLNGFDQKPAGEPAPLGENENVPDWLSGLEEKAINEPAVTSGSPDWLKGLDSDQIIEPAPEGNLPDWLNGLEAKDGKTSASAVSVESLGATSQEQDDAVAWLESLAAKHGAKPEEMVTDPNKRSEATPEWVSQAQELGSPAVTVESLGSTAQEQDAAVAWLESLAAKHGAKPEEMVTDPNKRSEATPEWVSQAQSIADAQSAPVVPVEEPKPEVVENALNIGEQFFAEFENASAAAPATDETSAWLLNLEADEKQEQPANAVEDLPDWLREPVPQAEKSDWQVDAPQQGMDDAIEQISEHEQPVNTTQDVQAWLSETESLIENPEIQAEAPQGQDALEQVSELGQPPSAVEDIPDWLRDATPQPEKADWQDDAFDQIQVDEGQEVVKKDTETRHANMPDWLSAAETETEPVNIDADRGLPESDLSSWLNSLDDEPGLPFDALPTPDSILFAAQPSGSETKSREPEFVVEASQPDWMSAAEPENVPAEDVLDSPAISKAEELPAWLQEGVGTEETTDTSYNDDDAPPWMRREQWEAEEEPQQLQPTSPSDWHTLEPAPVESTTTAPAPAVPAPVAARVAAQPKQEALIESQMPFMPPSPEPSSVPAVEKAAAPAVESAQKKKISLAVRKLQPDGGNTILALTQAKGELDRGDIPAALSHYAKLIKKGKHIEETIRDLAESIYRYPVEVGIWQTLGDAYMRANRLKEALEAYNKAEELIR